MCPVSVPLEVRAQDWATSESWHVGARNVGARNVRAPCNDTHVLALLCAGADLRPMRC
jgi:hypothetical protein